MIFVVGVADLHALVLDLLNDQGMAKFLLLVNGVLIRLSVI